MKTITCDFCNKEIKDTSRQIIGKFYLHIENGLYQVSIDEIKMTMQFNTTGLDVCKQCLINGIKNADYS